MAVDASVADPDGKDIGAVREAVLACSKSADYKEGRRAFMEKRRPAFQGR